MPAIHFDYVIGSAAIDIFRSVSSRKCITIVHRIKGRPIRIVSCGIVIKP